MREWVTPVFDDPVTTPATAVPETTAPATDVAVSDIPAERATDRGLSLLTYALRTRELSLIDSALLSESASELLAITRSELMAIRLDPTVLSDLRAYRPNLSFLLAPFALLGGAARRITAARPRVATPTPRVSEPKEARPARMKAHKQPKEPKAPRVAAAPRAPRVRVRWGRVLTRGLSLGILAAILIALPSEMIGNVGTMAADLSVAIREKIAAMTPATPALQRASFDVPPLSSYGASFEAQAPYPHASPNATVEWVVALRNTGSVGWYRGIDGAQASLAFADGRTAGVQTTPYVGPGQVGWFVVHFTAPAEPGTSKVQLLPRIDGRGALPDLGIYATVTVSANP